MNMLEHLPAEWQQPYCPGNGHGLCGGGLRSERTYSPVNSAWTIRRVCHYGHSFEAVINVPGGSELDLAAKEYKYDTRPRKCAECGVKFIPDAGNQILCKFMACKKHIWTRHHYTRFLVKKGIERQEANRLAIIKHPRFGAWQGEKRNLPPSRRIRTIDSAEG